MKNLVIRSVLTLAALPIFALAQTSAVPAALAPPQFLTVFSVSPYTDPSTGYGIVLLNPFYFASVETANALAVRFGAIPVKQSFGTARFYVVELAPAQLKPPIDFLSLTALPQAYMLMLQFPGGCTSNAGYIASFYRNNPPDKFPGLADKFALANLRADCPNDNVTIH